MSDKKFTSATLGMSAAALQQQLSKNLGLPSVNTTHKKPRIPNETRRERNRKFHARDSHDQRTENASITMTSTKRAGATKRIFAPPYCDLLGEERVIIRPPLPNLAQRLNLVMPPPKELSGDDWNRVRAEAAARVSAQGPSTSAAASDESLCPICLCEFGLRSQILLSCSHTFHQCCLQTYERHVGKRVCPICRLQEYQGLRINDGAILYQNAMATRIQAVWRGFRCRKLLEKKGKLPHAILHTMCLNRMAAVTSRLTKITQSNTTDIGQFLDALSVSSTNCKAVINLAYRRATQKKLTNEHWDGILKFAQQRNRFRGECAICMSAFRTPSKCTKHDLSLVVFSSKSKSNKSPSEDGEQLVQSIADGPATVISECVLLSCTHVFHRQCLDALERYTFGDAFSTCPICRASYQRRGLYLTK
eukprot:m.206378 g.206378  ORF g.206378 m.206378 type:complete len:420 (+) comp18900_c0_seq2:418-1677(+)